MCILDFESQTRQQPPIFGLPLWKTTITDGEISEPVCQYGNSDHESFRRALDEYNRRCAKVEGLVS